MVRPKWIVSLSELSLERTSQDCRMQGHSPFLGAWKGLYHEGQSQQRVCIQCLVTCPFGQAHLIEGGPCATTAMGPWEVNLPSCILSKQSVLCGLETSISCCFLEQLGVVWPQ
jgi:hypothetical protein